MNWREKLNAFLEDWEYTEDTIGVLVCGSYITGSPSPHSDLDVHIILDDSVAYRERGNKIIDGLLVEYFANSPKQIRKYFKEDYEEISSMSQIQFITGEIILDKTGIVKELKEEAKRMLNTNFSNINTNVNDLQKYGIWDMLDDLQDIYESKREDFDFIYYNCLDKLLSIYMKYIKHPYNKKTMIGNITSEIVRNKYLLKELPDKEISDLIYKCITVKTQSEMLDSYEKLTNKLLGLFGGFNINQFKFKSKSDV